jgi:hypothetical protein
MRELPGLVRSGIIAGVAAGTVIVLWFMVVDWLQGAPLQTPAFLANVLLRLGDGSVAVVPVAIYTAVHYIGFVLVGIAMAWVAARAELVPGALLGFALGFLLFDLMFYGSLLITGTAVVRELGWAAVLAGNIMAGLVLFGVLGALGARRPASWAEMLAEHRTLREGLATGLIGAAAVALWFLVVDVLAGRIFFTPAALGSAIFLGARGVGDVDISAAVILGYTILHVVASLLVGCFAAFVVRKAEEESEVILLGAILLFVTFAAFFVGMLAILFNWLVAVLSPWNIAVANLIAALSMGVYLYLRHPALLHDLRTKDLEEELARPDPEASPVQQVQYRGR